MTKPLIKKILVPVDYSLASKRVAKVAADLARQLKAELFVFHSYGLPVVGLSEAIVIADEISDVQEKKLKDFVSELKAESGELRVHSILEFGTPVDWIARLAEDKAIDLIVMSTRGDSDVTNKFFGSVTSHVINQVKCPVLIIPKGYHLHAISELIYASDFHYTNNSAEYLAPMLTLINEFQPFVHMVHFSQNKIQSPHNGNVEEMKLSEILKGTKHSFHYLEATNVEDSLFEFTAKYHGDLIVAVTRHYTIWERIFHQSLTKKLVLHSEVPLLILHEDYVQEN